MEEKSLNIFYADDRLKWRRYLSENYRTEKEVWFVFPVKASGEESVSYNDAVEEALCFDWIDSTNRRLDDLHCIRRFTPRIAGSTYSQPNIERLIWLDSQGMIMPEVRTRVLAVITAPFVYPQDIMAAVKADEQAWKNYQAFSEPYRRIRIAYIEASRKRPDEFEKRLRSFIDKTRAGKLIKGYGGIDKYYS